MLKKSRLFFTAILVALLLFSPFIVPSSAQACPVRIPSTLLSLYLESDLIILADYKSEQITGRENEDENGFYASLERDLDVIQILKGKENLKQITFSDNEYRSKSDVTVASYGSGTTPIIGNRYLFFLTKDEEISKYRLTDKMSAVKDVEGKFGVYEKSISELKAIVANEKNQLANLNEWLVKGLEEPVTRWDSTYDIYRSFNILNWETENPEDMDDIPFRLGKYSQVYTSAIAKNITDSQKNRICALLFESLQKAWFSADSDDTYIDYRLTSIVSSWDKSRLAIYGFSILQSINKEDSSKRKRIMDFISDVIDDEELSSIYYDYIEKVDEIDSQNDETTTPEAKKELSSLLETRNSLFKNFNDRFQFMFVKNFEPVEETEEGK